MKKLFGVVVLAVVVPCYAQTAPTAGKKQSWAPGTDEFIIGVTAEQNQAPKQTNVDVTAAWGHYFGNMETGSAISIFRRGNIGGGGAGPFVEMNFPSQGSGHFFIGGNLLGLVSQASQDAVAAGTATLGYKQHLGTDHAIRYAVNFQRAVGLKAGGDPNQLDQVALTIGFSVAATPPTK